MGGSKIFALFIQFIFVVGSNMRAQEGAGGELGRKQRWGGGAKNTQYNFKRHNNVLKLDIFLGIPDEDVSILFWCSLPFLIVDEF